MSFTDYSDMTEEVVCSKFKHYITGPLYIKESEFTEILDYVNSIGLEYQQAHKIKSIDSSTYTNKMMKEKDNFRIVISINGIDYNDSYSLVIYFSDSPGKRNINFEYSRGVDFLLTSVSGSEDILSNTVSANIARKIIKEMERRHTTNLDMFFQNDDSEGYEVCDIQVDRSRDRAALFRYSVDRNDLEMLDKRFYPYLDVEKLARAFYFSQSPMLVLYGEPGTGKSKLTTMLINIIFNRFIFSSNDVVTISGENIKDPIAVAEFKNTFLSTYNALFLIDDINLELLSDRGNGDNILLESLLTSLDGIKQTSNKIIITSNSFNPKSDSPLFRSGRLFAGVEIKKLPVSYVERVFGKIIPEGYEYDEISSADIVELQELNGNKDDNTSFYIDDDQWK